MLSLIKKALGLVLALFACFQVAYSQQTDQPAKAETTELREKAFTVLDSLAGQLSSLQSPENRARIGANLAASLWTRDEKRARALFQLVQDDIKLGLQTRGETQSAEQTLQVFRKLREDTIHRIAKHDAELALVFLRETFPFVQESGSYRDGRLRDEVAAREKALETELGRTLARNHPQEALKLARKSLAGEDFDDELRHVLLQLSFKHKEEARVLHLEIVNKIANTNLKLSYNALYFSSRLAQTFTPPAADTATFRDLLNILLTLALESGCAKADGGPPVCYSVGPLVPRMAQYFPNGAARLSRWAREGEVNEPDSYHEVLFQLGELREKGDLEEMMALATKHPQMEGEITMLALRTAESMGDLDLATKLATEYRGSPEIRQRLTNRVTAYGIAKAEIAARYTQMQQALGEMPLQAQLEQLLSFANNVASSDRAHAIKALNQARDLIDNLEPGAKQTSDYMTVAAMYCLVKSDQGFAIMEAMLPKLNELISAAAKLDGFNTRYLRQGEWNMSAEGDLGNLLTFLSQRAGVFAWYDFDRAINLAAQFERSEIRMMAQLKLAQGVLATPPKRLFRGFGAELR